MPDWSHWSRKRKAAVDGLATLITGVVLGVIVLVWGYQFSDPVLTTVGCFLVGLGVFGSVFDYYRHLKMSKPGRGFFL